MATEHPIPVTVLSGFLGSGKTTLLNVLLRAPHGLRLAVIVNEFGAVGIDGALVPQGERFVELDNGCLCCALNSDLVETLTDIVAQGDVDHVVIETTGLADPLPVAWTCTRPGLSAHLRVDAVVTVVDAAAVGRAILESEEARRQIGRADILLLNKLDVVNDDGAAARAAMVALNPEAPVLTSIQAQVPWQLILGQEPRVSRTMRHGGDAPSHAHDAQTLSYTSWSFTRSAQDAVDEQAVETLCYAVPPSVFRFKGLLRVDCEEGPWLLVNAVAGRIDLRFMTPEVLPQESALVFIGQNLDPQMLAALCHEHLGEA